MKRTIIVLFLGAFFTLFYSCEKDDSKLLLEQATDVVRGTYQCVSMTYLGDALDLDDDGVCNTDLKAEFEHFSFGRTIFNRASFIYPAVDFCQEELFNLAIPVQDIRFRKITKDYVMINGLGGSDDYLSFAYSVNENGSLSFQVRNDHLYRDANWELDDEINHIDVSHTYGERVVSCLNGILTVRIIGAYYDFHTEQFVTGPVELVYERVSYAVN